MFFAWAMFIIFNITKIVPKQPLLAKVVSLLKVAKTQVMVHIHG